MSESKYKERAKKIFDNTGDNQFNFGVTDINYQDVITAMCKLAEEVEKELKDSLYTVEDIQDLQIEFAAEKLDMYTKQQVEELLQKQRELCCTDSKLVTYVDYEGDTISCAMVDKNSILNAKLEI